MPNLSPHSIPIRRNRAASTIQYVSAIALKLSSLCQTSADDIARQVVRALSPQGNAHPRLIPLYQSDLSFTVDSPASGWLTFQFNDRALGTWLHQVLQFDLAVPPDARARISPSSYKEHMDTAMGYFDIQYAHARIRSLLDLLQREHWLPIELESFIIPSHSDRKLDISHLSWLKSDGSLRLQQPAERLLINELIDTVDGLGTEGTPPTEYVRLGQRLSQRFHAFHAHCSFGGRWRTTNPDDFLACVGLLMATRVVLRSLLEEGLHLEAATEL